MPKIATEFKRKFFRWYFASAKQPTELQTRGVALKLYTTTLFGREICHAVLKDMSLGGAGVLAPTSTAIPAEVLLVYGARHKIKARVVYQRQINDKLVFLGVRWLPGKEQFVLQLLRTLSKKAYRESQRQSSTLISEQHE